MSLINDILDFSKIEAGKLDLEVLDFDVRTTLEDVVDMLAVAGRRQGAGALLPGLSGCPLSCAGRSRQAPAGPAQPGRECDQVHRRGGSPHPRACDTRDRNACDDAFRRYGHGDRHPDRQPGPAVSVLLPGGRLDHAQVWGHGSGAGDLQAAGRDDGWPDRRSERGRQGLHVLVHRSAGETTRRPRRGSHRPGGRSGCAHPGGRRSTDQPAGAQGVVAFLGLPFRGGRGRPTGPGEPPPGRYRGRPVQDCPGGYADAGHGWEDPGRKDQGGSGLEGYAPGHAHLGGAAWGRPQVSAGRLFRLHDEAGQGVPAV